MIYLDSAATTQLDPAVLNTMIEYMKYNYGNPSSKYYQQAVDAQNDLKKARTQVAKLLNTELEYILFTSGASESNNFILKGIADKYSSKKNHIITSKIEHKSVLEPLEYLKKKGFEISYLDVDPNGVIDLESLQAAITDNTALVSIMWANNEIGSVNDMVSISKICKEHGVLLHSDATQAIGKMNIDLSNKIVDFMSFSGHKIYGPKGIGIAYVGPDNLGIRYKLSPLIHGGSQEFKMRSGTHAMHDIVGIGMACEIAKETMNSNVSKILALEKYLVDGLVDLDSNITINAYTPNKLPGLVSINIPGINNEILIKQLSPDIAISTGSACSINEPSYVATALGKPTFEILRISISKFTTEAEINILLDKIKSLI